MAGAGSDSNSSGNDSSTNMGEGEGEGEGLVLAAHNAKFDLRFLLAELERGGIGRYVSVDADGYGSKGRVSFHFAHVLPWIYIER